MRYFLVIISVFLSQAVNAQENYTSLIKKARLYEQDSTKQRKALYGYLNAFKTYPDSITENDQYWFTVLASHLKENDLAFKYLIPLANLEKDESGFPGWDLIVGDYSEEDYSNLFSDVRWKALKQKAGIQKQAFFENLQIKETEFYSTNQQHLNAIKAPAVLYKKLKSLNPYKPKNERNYSISFTINDTTKTSFFVHLPPRYNPEKKYPLLFILHGAVRGNSLLLFQTAELNLTHSNRYYTKYAEENNIILVFPRGNKQYNWMSPDNGFFMIPEMVKHIKKALNINDNKVFVSGHSNGATGAFSYLMKQSTPFAGVYGFNTYPMVFTGGTFVENSKNRSFINFSTDNDYYYPPNANDSFTQLMTRINADFKEYRYNGFPHWFPEFDASEPAFKILFNDIKTRERNPFPNEISWEFDDNTYGNIDWLSNIKLDTLNQKANWHKTRNFKITKWLKFKNNNSNDLMEINVDKKAFNFPRKSGKIVASYKNNVFRIETSNIASFSILISPEMVNLKKKVTIYMNGKRYLNQKTNYNRAFMLQSFQKNQDRKQIWVNCIKVTNIGIKAGD